MPKESFEQEGISKQLKDQINQEGWDGNAAVLIGSKEELTALEERLEREGRTKNLETYLRLHKEVLVSKSDPEMEHMIERLSTKEGIDQVKPGWILTDSWFGNDLSKLTYIDSLGNIAACNITSDLIAEYKNLTKDALLGKVKQDLENHGFQGYVIDKNLGRLMGVGMVDPFDKDGNQVSPESADELKERNFMYDLWNETSRAIREKKIRLEKESLGRSRSEFDL